MELSISQHELDTACFVSQSLGTQGYCSSQHTAGSPLMCLPASSSLHSSDSSQKPLVFWSPIQFCLISPVCIFKVFSHNQIINSYNFYYIFFLLQNVVYLALHGMQPFRLASFTFQYLFKFLHAFMWLHSSFLMHFIYFLKFFEVYPNF